MSINKVAFYNRFTKTIWKTQPPQSGCLSGLWNSARLLQMLESTEEGQRSGRDSHLTPHRGPFNLTSHLLLERIRMESAQYFEGFDKQIAREKKISAKDSWGNSWKGFEIAFPVDVNLFGNQLTDGAAKAGLNKSVKIVKRFVTVSSNLTHGFWEK